MAKSKAKKSVTAVKKGRKFSSTTQRNLLIIGGALIGFGLLLFVMQSQAPVQQQESTQTAESVETSGPTAFGPSQGCSLTGTNYVCDIKITNPKDKPLEWSSLITGLEGATVSGGGYGTVEPMGSAVVKLSVPKAFCDANPEGEGSVLVIEDQKSSNQAETQFKCSPESSVSETVEQ